VTWAISPSYVAPSYLPQPADWSRNSVVEAGYEFGVAVDREVRVVAGEDDLATRFRIPDLANDVLGDLAVQDVFRLIENERRAVLAERNTEKSCCLSPAERP
jgi:hypothetical protein